jgi:hypothetical protein
VHVRWIVLLVIACGGKPHPARHACVPVATAALEVAAARDRNRQVLLDDIRGRGLELVTLTGTVARRGGEQIEWTSEGTQALSPVFEGGCGAVDPSAEFVKNAAGEIWALASWPAAKSRRSIAVCACASQLPMSCGGAAPPRFQLAFELPAGLTFRGKLDIAYQVEEVSISYADYRPGSGCPPMPPPDP